MEPGTRIGRYVVEDRVGHGGMAEVWRVRDDEGAPFALKVLTLDRPGVRERFLTEARIMLALDHPNLVRAHEILDVDGETALVMEFVPGPSLDRWLVENPTPIEVLDRLAEQVLDAVGHAHEQGLVHRDLKPANVLVLDTPSGPVAKVTDFGLAKQLAVSTTRTGMTLGTPRYMAPEQIRDAKRVDERADIWSLGVLLCELYTGYTPFDQETLAEVFSAVLEARYTDPATHGAPERVARALRACLVKDPAGRPQSTHELAVLLGFESGAPVRPSLPPGSEPSLYRRISMADPTVASHTPPPTAPLPTAPLPAPPGPGATLVADPPRAPAWTAPSIPPPALVPVQPRALSASELGSGGALPLAGSPSNGEPPPRVSPPARPRGLGIGGLVVPWIAAWAAALLLVALVFGVGVAAIGAWTWEETTAREPLPAPPPPPPPRPDRRPRRPGRDGRR